MRVPISRDLQKAYRDTLQIPDSPDFINTDNEVVPVAIIANPTNPASSMPVIITDGTDTAQVTTTGYLQVSLEEPNLRRAGGTFSGTGPTTIATVPAGKTWRVYHICLMTLTPTGSASGYTYLTMAGSNYAFKNIGTLVGDIRPDRVNLEPYPVDLATGSQIQVSSGVATDGEAYILYEEI